MNLRSYTPDDYPDIVNIQNSNFPDMPAVVEDYAESDQNMLKDERSVFTRLVVEQDNHVVGYLQYYRNVWNFDPHHFQVTLRMHPNYQQKGLGTQLAKKLTEWLAPYKPTKLNATVREYHPHGLVFAQKYGFVEFHRNSESKLTLADFDANAYQDVESRLEIAGIEIKSYNELHATHPNLDQHLYDLFQIIEQDIPGDEPHQEPGFTVWRDDYLNNPRLDKDAFKIALHGNAMVGVSNLWTDLASDMLYTDLTGVKREYRGQGIAVALKLAVIQWAQVNNYSAIKTQNEVNNIGMLSINQRLGYQQQPAWIYLKKEITD